MTAPELPGAPVVPGEQAARGEEVAVAPGEECAAETSPRVAGQGWWARRKRDKANRALPYCVDCPDHEACGQGACYLLGGPVYPDGAA